jgi:hypothetical protein
VAGCGELGSLLGGEGVRAVSPFLATTLHVDQRALPYEPQFLNFDLLLLEQAGKFVYVGPEGA